MLDSHAPNRDPGSPGPVGGRLAMFPVRDLAGGARALCPPEQGVGNGLLDRTRLSTDGPVFGVGLAYRPTSPDHGRRRGIPPRVARRAVNPSLLRWASEQGGHTNSQLWCNEYIYCAAASRLVVSVTNPHSVAGSEGERGPAGRSVPADPTRYRGLASDARGSTDATCRHRADSTRARHRRLTPSPHRQAVCGGDRRRADPSTGAAPASATERRRPGWTAPSRGVTAGEVPARMRMTAHTGLATDRPRVRAPTASTHRGEVQFDDRTDTNGLQKGGNPRGSR